ncbi:MAG: hypothetical protein ACRDYV_10530, partial [Acidimicrobiia bacterium]
AKADTAEAAAIAAATTDATTKANAAQAAAEAASVPLAEKAAASGVASLDASSKLVQTLDAAKVVSGTFDAARIPTLTAYAPATVTTNTQTGSYTLVLTDAGKVVEQNAAGANNLTVPPNSSVAFPTGTIIVIRQYGAGLTTVVASAGVTIRSRGGALDMGGQYAEATLTKRGTDEWVLSGDIV